MTSDVQNKTQQPETKTDELTVEELEQAAGGHINGNLQIPTLTSVTAHR